MTKLETTLLNLAHQHLAWVISFLELGSRGQVRPEDEEEFLKCGAALDALLELGHLADSGMSEGAVKRMLEVEGRHAVIMRAGEATPALSPGQHVDFRFQDGSCESVDVSKVEHVLELGGFVPKV